MRPTPTWHWQKKIRRNNGEDNCDIKNHGNDYIFKRNGIEPTDYMKEVAVSAIKALRLDFGAVDMAVVGEECFVFEVNTAPGLTGTTIDNYKSFFEKGLQHVRI